MATEYLDGWEPKPRKFKPLDEARVRANAQRKGEEEVYPWEGEWFDDDAPEPEGSAFEEIGNVDRSEQIAAQNDWCRNIEEDFDDDGWCRFHGKLVPRHVAEHIKAVEVEWAKSAASRIKIGKRLLAMKKEVGDGEWLTAFKLSHMPFALRTAQEYMQLAKHRVIGDARNSAHLPAKRQPLVLLASSKVPDSVLEDLIRAGTVNPSMTIKDVQNLYVFKLPDLFNQLLSFSKKHTATEMAEHAGYQLQRKHEGNMPSVLAGLKTWLDEFSEAFFKVEHERRAEWEAQMKIEAAEQREKEEADRLTKAWREKQSLEKSISKKYRPRSSP
jgi:hypothetical protein